jgi:rare lipoprotein A
LLGVLGFGSFSYSQDTAVSIPDTFRIQPPISLSFSDTDSVCSRMYCKSGIASYYGPGFHGRPTSSGERFDRNKYTAAHKTLPLGTYVVVTNLTNQKSVVVKINDRMPPWNMREIDLAERVASHLDFKHAGLTKVQIEILKPIK